jgi:putative Mg2+ transporter-C (MgtC) family protein
MSPLPLTLDWRDIALRLALTAVAGILIGIDRDEQGRPAGLRTTLLVCLAACIAMIEANVLLGTTGKAQNSFIQMDPMRLPLGILSGMGFLGAGAIVRRGDLVLGVTTAATLWITTVIGLCFGGGQIALGLSALVFGMVVLSVLKLVEKRLPQDHRAVLRLTAEAGGPTAQAVRARIEEAGFRIVRETVAYSEQPRQEDVEFHVRWRGARNETAPPDVVTRMAEEAGILTLEWKPAALEAG